MIGLVLWFNPKAQVGMIWCEDQGPLAFLGPDVVLPERNAVLDCGDQVTFSIELCDGVRHVRDVYAVLPGAASSDPREIIAGYHQSQERARHLSIVA